MLVLSRPWKSIRPEEALTACLSLLVLWAAGCGAFVPGFYTGVVDPRYLTGTIMADWVSLFCAPLLIACVRQARRGSRLAGLAWLSLLAYLGYAYATYAFDRMYTPLFPVYVLLFGLCVFLAVNRILHLDVRSLAAQSQALRFRRGTAVLLAFTGLILYVIEAPTLLARIPGGIDAGGTPFMVLDMALVAPFSMLTARWVWQRRPWGDALAGVFLIKALALMTGFLVADYIDWSAGRLATPGATVAFTCVYACVCFFAWNYFTTFLSSTNEQGK
ncbi:MAG: hypothetical protein ACOYYS_26130 [Chloroflexota bacterium]